VNADCGGVVERRTVTVGGATLSTIQLRWPA